MQSNENGQRSSFRENLHPDGFKDELQSFLDQNYATNQRKKHPLSLQQ